MKNGFSFIWDLDGTLLDSYDVMTRSLFDALAESGIRSEQQAIYHRVIESSVSTFLSEAAAAHGLDRAVLQEAYSRISGARMLEIPLMAHAAEILSTLRAREIPSFVFTHRGSTTIPVLENLGILSFFREIVTVNDGFPRKPAPDALLYLIEKHRLDPDCCYYVGDRSLDIRCAGNAGIRSILFLPPGSPGTATGQENFVFHDLIEILSVLQN